MPKIVYYDDIKIIKKPYISKLKKIFIFFLILLVFGGVVYSSFFLSQALTVGNLSVALVYGDTTIKIKKSSRYAVVLGKYDNLEDAQKVALGSIVQGASGYIWHDVQYLVIGSIYSNQSDAEKVMSNLKTSNYNLTTYEIAYPSVTLKLDTLENKQVAKIRSAIEFFDTTFDKLYDYSISFDKGENNNYAISSYISNLRGDTKVNISYLQSLTDSGIGSIRLVLESLILLDTLLNTLIIKTIDNATTNYSLKNAMVSVSKIKLDMLCAIA